MNTLRIAIPALLVALALAGCGDDKETRSTISVDRCVENGVVCGDTAGVSCDPTDGVCKCGGKGGMVCGPGTVCDVDLAVTPPAASCVSELCAGVPCDPFETCDVTDGLCKCKGQICGDGRTCLASGCSDETPCAGVVCADNFVCDPSDRMCKCGGHICSAGESCRQDDKGVGHCVGRKCVGKNCAGGTVCNPVDGLCHCGSADGDVCTAGQACVEDEGESVCVGNNICEGVVCSGNTACSPLDGKCRCGGYDAVAPVCADDQICDLGKVPPSCAGGDLCIGVTCEASSNLSCDGETGDCRCGGTGGLACAPGEGCIDSDGKAACVLQCDPTAANVAISVCGEVEGGPKKGCYLSPADGLAFCADAGEETEGRYCLSPRECSAGHHCVLAEDTIIGVCRRYCDTSVLNSCYFSERACKPLSVQAANAPHLGICVGTTE